MSATTQGPIPGERLYLRSVPATASRGVLSLLLAIALVAAVALFIFGDLPGGWLRVVTGILIALATPKAWITAFRLLASITPRNLAAAQRASIGVSDAGVRLDTVLVPWREIERVVLMCHQEPGAGTAALLRLVGLGINQVVIVRRRDVEASATSTPKRKLRGGHEDFLAGNKHASYVAAGRDLIATGAAQGVPVELYESGRPWMHEQLGHPTVTTNRPVW